MSLRLSREIHDHHNAQRLHALRGYAKHADRLDGRAEVNWLLLALILAFAMGVAFVIGMPEIVAAL